MRDDLEIIYMLLFPFVGNGFQLAPCNVSWLATRGSVVLVPDPIVFAPWSVLLDRGELCGCQDTSHEAASACFLSQEWPVTGETHSVWTEWHYHKSIGRATLAMRWTALRATPSSCCTTTMAGPKEARFGTLARHM